LSGNKKIDFKKVLSVIGTVFTVIIFAFAAYLIINMVVSRIKNEPVKVFGYSFAIVQTGSMEPEIMTGDLIVFRSVDYGSIEVGDVIVFRADSSFGKMEGQTIVHRVDEITDDGLVTKGVNEKTNPTADGGVRDESEVLGICIANSTFWGAIFTFLGKYGILFLILAIAIPVIVKLVIKIVKLSREKDGESEDDIGTVNTESSEQQGENTNVSQYDSVAETADKNQNNENPTDNKND